MSLMELILSQVRAISEALHGMSRSTGALVTALILGAPLAMFIWSAIVMRSELGESMEVGPHDASSQILNRVVRSTFLRVAAYVVLLAGALWFALLFAVLALSFSEYGTEPVQGGGRTGGGNFWIIGSPVGFGVVCWNLVLFNRVLRARRR